MDVELLIVPDCPNEGAAAVLVRRALDDVGPIGRRSEPDEPPSSSAGDLRSGWPRGLASRVQGRVFVAAGLLPPGGNSPVRASFSLSPLSVLLPFI